MIRMIWRVSVGLFLVLGVSAYAGATRTIDADAITSSDHSITHTLPSSTGTLINTAPGTSGNVLTSNGSAWTSAAASGGGSSGVTPNLLLNGNFELWQRGTSTTIGNGSTPYLADRFYVINGLGTNGVLTYSQVSPVQTGSKWGLKVQVTTAPTAAQANGTELYQTLENADTLPLLVGSISQSVQVKAFGTVATVGLQFMYKTTEAKVDTTLGAETSCAVNTSTFVTCKAENISVSTTPTSSGVVGVRLRILTVSSGHTYDLNNGFVAEQFMMNAGATVAAFRRRGSSFADELEQAIRFYEKTYNLTVAPGTNAPNLSDGLIKMTPAAGSRVTFHWKRKSKSGAIQTYWGPYGTINTVSNDNGGSDNQSTGGTYTSGGECGDLFFAAGQNSVFAFHWTVDAEI